MAKLKTFKKNTVSINKPLYHSKRLDISYNFSDKYLKMQCCLHVILRGSL